MALIDWNESLSVEIAEIDHQHKKLVNILNELHAAMRQGQSKTVMAEIVDRLVDYTATHFATEEEYFDEFKYDETGPHKMEHADRSHRI